MAPDISEFKIIPGMLPPDPDVCQECAVEHEPEMPHNQQSLFYQYKFYNEHGRWPTWLNSMAHCTEEMQALWRIELLKRGVQLG